MGVREDKVQVVEELKEKFSSAQGTIIADYRGLDVADVTELRAKLREAGVEYKVVKNTLAKLAVKDTDYESVSEHLQGPTAIAFSPEDPVAPAKIIHEFSKENEALKIKAGILEGEVIDFSGVKALAELPSREQLLAQTVAALQSPITGFVNVMQANTRDFVNVLDAIKNKKEQEA
ncbi:50S ribosomal protein L10 [Proteinivorax tanatarense]|uniref:Large ribosomal subunit protein uL10 n=1 Tax=Proteinivorax tanatarense TaxID=1260629 RepID=A0AAU7VLW9_9FIRM